MKGPIGLLLAAAWNLTEVLAGVVAFHESVVHLGATLPDGLASFTTETKLPLDA